MPGELPAQSYRKKLLCLHIDDGVKLEVRPDRNYGVVLEMTVVRNGRPATVGFDLDLTRSLLTALKSAEAVASRLEQEALRG